MTTDALPRLKTVTALRDHLHPLRTVGPVVLVPTMGALHEGHGSLVALARREAGRDGTVVVSIFVNPAQFGPREDLASYPRSLDDDCELCRQKDADLVFCPNEEEIYHSNHSTTVGENALSRRLCGRSRPGHFAGVCLVVSQLFGICQPDIAVFGEKDFQQLAVIRRMVRDLHMSVRIVGAPTVREKSGLALSSRNRYLTATQREKAAFIYRALKTAREAVRGGECSVPMLLNRARKIIESIPGARIDYLEAVDAANLGPLEVIGEDPAVFAVAVYLGKARLIDNIRLNSL